MRCQAIGPAERRHEARLASAGLLIPMGLLMMAFGLAAACIHAGPHEAWNRAVRVMRDSDPAAVAGYASFATVGGVLFGASLRSAVYHHGQLKSLRENHDGQEMVPIEGGKAVQSKQPRELTPEDRRSMVMGSVGFVAIAGLAIFVAHHVVKISGPMPVTAGVLTVLAAGAGTTAGFVAAWARKTDYPQGTGSQR
jgi:hypothetical protein